MVARWTPTPANADNQPDGSTSHLSDRQLADGLTMMARDAHPNQDAEYTIVQLPLLTLCRSLFKVLRPRLLNGGSPYTLISLNSRPERVPFKVWTTTVFQAKVKVIKPCVEELP